MNSRGRLLCRLFVLRAALLLCAASAGAQSPAVNISGVLEWDKMEISARVSLELKPLGLALPTGRTQAEELIAAEYAALIRPLILSIPVDSSSFVGDHVAEGAFSLYEAEDYALSARTSPPAMTSGMTHMQAAYTISLRFLSARFIKNPRPAAPPRVLATRPTTAYTGILIIAGGELPLHGTNRKARTLPCLFPKIWDSAMTLIYDKTMLESPETVMVHYAGEESIFQDSPSGLSPELAALVGDRPLRILAREVYGIRPTDLVIDEEDARSIIAGEENRELLRQGRVVIVLDT
ncbi:MAG: polymerase, partial [Treponema sp.]|nr:polymerase [Treponema sp.]